MTWGKALIRDVASFVMGQAPPGTEVNEIGLGIPFFRSGEFEDIRPKIAAWTTKPLRLALPTDVFVCVVGANAGEVNRGADGAIGRSIGAVRSGDRLDHDYLYYFLRSIEVYLRNAAQGSAQAVISKDDLGRIEIPLPVLAEQRAIAGVLVALDDKIESSRRLLDTIDGLLRAELETAIANDDNPREVRFGEIALRVGEAADPRNLREHVPYIGLEHMPRGSMFLDRWGTSEGLGSGKSVFKEGDVLFGRLRPYFKKVGVAPIGGICSTDVLVLRPAFNESAAVLLALAASEEFIGYASAAATGTKMPRVSWDYLSDWKTVLPSEAATNRFDIDMSPLVAKAIFSVHEQVALAQLRNALLPEMLSGRLRVKDAESMMENV
jgi:type I restriction enzyme S subunit